MIRRRLPGALALRERGHRISAAVFRTAADLTPPSLPYTSSTRAAYTGARRASRRVEADARGDGRGTAGSSVLYVVSPPPLKPPPTLRAPDPEEGRRQRHPYGGATAASTLRVASTGSRRREGSRRWLHPLRRRRHSPPAGIYARDRWEGRGGEGRRGREWGRVSGLGV